MSFKSKIQMRMMFSKMPGLAHKWKSKYGVPENMPMKMAQAKKKKSNITAYARHRIRRRLKYKMGRG
jgi:hypothetical protein